MPIDNYSSEHHTVHEMYSLDTLQPSSSDDEESYSKLDQCIDQACTWSKDLFSIDNVIHSWQKHKCKCQKTNNLKPIVFIRFNKRKSGRPKSVTLKALLDSGGSSSLLGDSQVC